MSTLSIHIQLDFLFINVHFLKTICFESPKSFFLIRVYNHILILSYIRNVVHDFLNNYGICLLYDLIFHLTGGQYIFYRKTKSLESLP